MADRLVRIGYWLGLLAVGPGLVIVARTWRGRLTGVMALGMVLFIGFFFTLIGTRVILRSNDPPVEWLWLAVLLPAVACLFVPACVLSTRGPRWVADPGGGVESHFLGPGWPPSPNSPITAAWCPESDILRLGVALVTRFDPWMSRAEAQVIRRRTGELLGEMDADPAYRHLAPAWWLWFEGHSRGEPDTGHFFSYTPPHDPDERLGLLVFLHGHGGNFALLLHAWRRFADAHRVVVVCPSFGYGNWEHPAGIAAVERCLDYVGRHFPVAAGRVFLAGISQGGCGVGRAGAALADRFAGLVFLSPTMEPDVLGSPEFVTGWKGRPVFVAQGGRDHNVKPRTVDAGVELLRASGAAVTYHFDPAADHFLFFAHLDEITAHIGEWTG